MLEKFKNFDTEGMSLEDLVVLAAFGRALRTEYEAQSLDEPEFVGIQINTLKREIKNRNADRITSLIREKKARLQALKPTEDIRKELALEIEKLEKAQLEHV